MQTNQWMVIAHHRRLQAGCDDCRVVLPELADRIQPDAVVPLPLPKHLQQDIEDRLLTVSLEREHDVPPDLIRELFAHRPHEVWPCVRLTQPPRFAAALVLTSGSGSLRLAAMRFT